MSSAGTMSGRRIRYLLSGSPGKTVGFRGGLGCEWDDANLCRAGKSKRECHAKSRGEQRVCDGTFHFQMLPSTNVLAEPDFILSALPLCLELE